jgi:hypothetical protein
VRNEEVLHRFKEERNKLRAINRRKANWIYVLNSLRFLTKGSRQLSFGSQ